MHIFVFCTYLPIFPSIASEITNFCLTYSFLESVKATFNN